MILRIVLWCLILAGTPAYGQESVTGWIDKLDGAYYYPQHQGLQKLSTRIEWSQLDLGSASKRYLNKPELIFTWERSRGSRFSLSLESQNIDQDLKQELLATARHYREAIIPLTLKEKLSHYRGSQLLSSKGRLHLEFESQDPEKVILKYQMIVDRNKRHIQKFRMLRNQDPKSITSTLRYIKKEGQWLIAESRSQFQIEGEDYLDVAEFSYHQTQGKWLPQKMIHSIKKEGDLVQSYIFRFKDYRLSIGERSVGNTP
jgi:hypothetical protein